MVQQPKAKAFPIDRGICQFDFNDHYAILGVPITANSSQVRKGYLLVAKSLHPDIYGLSPVDKVIATQYLAKMVNPAYQVLSQERERAEYSAILRLLGKRLIKRSQQVSPISEIAKKLIAVPNTINYEQSVVSIAKIQYGQIDKILEYTAHLSELNLVYILSQEGYKFSEINPTTPIPPIYTASSPSNFKSSSQGNSQTNSQTSFQNNRNDETLIQQNGSNATRSSTDPRQSAQSAKPAGTVQSHIRAAEECIGQKQWSAALKELKAGIQIDCNNSKCHALLGVVYMNQKLSGMAKVSFKQALRLNPQEPIAMQNIAKVDGTAAKPNPETQAKGKEAGKKGGLFGWLGK